MRLNKIFKFQHFKMKVIQERINLARITQDLNKNSPKHRTRKKKKKNSKTVINKTKVMTMTKIKNNQMSPAAMMMKL